MAIYTKNGDDGSTERGDGKRIRKSDVRVGAVGAIEEVAAHVGACLQVTDSPANTEIRKALEPTQSELLAIGAMLSGGGGRGDADVSLPESFVQRMEQQIDQACSKLPELTHFILPRGCELACRLHITRTVSRRAERNIVEMEDAGHTVAPIILPYLNRLSDLLFALSREANFNTGVAETLWNPRKTDK